MEKAGTGKKVAIVCIVILALAVLGREIYWNYKNRPLDSLSRAVYEELGKDAMYYERKEERDSGEAVYIYDILQKDAETITRFTEAINRAPNEEGKKIAVEVRVEFVSVAYCKVFRLQNYSDGGLEQADYDGFYSLYIPKNDHVPKNDQTVFFDPLTYVQIEGIRQLEVDSQIQQIAEEKGIDWYDYWPDLEEIIVDGEEAETE